MCSVLVEKVENSDASKEVIEREPEHISMDVCGNSVFAADSVGADTSLLAPDHSC